MTDNPQSDKWDTIYRAKIQQTDQQHIKAAYVLENFQHLLPVQGQALDLASGLGANALLLAQHRLQAHAWDISSVAITHLRQTAKSLNIEIKTAVRDIINDPPPQNTFDVIVISQFLERSIMPNIIAALRQNGLLFYQTFTRDQQQDGGPSNKKYRLDKNELLNLCKKLHILIYQEQGTLTDAKTNPHHQALLIGQRKTQ